MLVEPIGPRLTKVGARYKLGTTRRLFFASTRNESSKNPTSGGRNVLFDAYSVTDFLVESNFHRGDKALNTKLEFEVSICDK